MTMALKYYGAVPKNILSDNMKTIVKRSHRYEPTLTDVCQQISLHYQTNIQATRSYRPKDKAKVEGAVKNCYQRIYSKLVGQKHYSLRSLNDAIFELLEALNNRVMKSYDCSRWALFYKIEKAAMLSLPKSQFQIVKQSTMVVQKNYHVYLSEDKHYYSVPYRNVHKKVNLQYSNSKVEIYDMAANRIALHDRSFYKKGYSTKEEHMPENHKVTKELESWSEEDFLEKATLIGRHVRLCISKIMANRRYPQQGFRACLGVLRLAKNYGNHRVENTCKMLIDSKVSPSYKSIFNILSKKLDLVSSEPKSDSSKPIPNDNIRANYR